jgi:hypothetical protein
VQGDTCVNPYKALFPNFALTGGEVSSFEEAGRGDLDDYFASLPRVQFST